MKRILFNFAASASLLLLLVATLALWVRSYVVTDIFFHLGFEIEDDYVYSRYTMVSIGRGGIGYSSIVEPPHFDTFVRPFHTSDEPEYPNLHFYGPEHSKLGFKWGRFAKKGRPADNRLGARGFELVVPLWSLLLLPLPVPVIWLRRCSKTRGQAGHCRRCSYDLTGNTNGVCPECGTAVATQDTHSKTIKRISFNFAACVSLLLLAATLAVWVRSRYASDFLDWSNGYKDPSAFSNSRDYARDFHTVHVGSSGGGLFIYERLRFNGMMGSAGGSYGIPHGRRFQWERGAADEYPTPVWGEIQRYEGGVMWYGRHLGIEFALYRTSFPKYAFKDRQFYVLAPLPLLAILFAIAPAVYVIKLARRHRSGRKAGFQKCSSCGYNLTGNISGICPECGTPVAARLQ